MPKANDAISAFRYHYICTLERVLHQSSSRLLGRYALHRTVKFQHEALHTLQKRIVQLSRDAFTLLNARFELCSHPRRNLSHAQHEDEPSRQKRRQHDGRHEPPCLVEGRQYLKGHARSWFTACTGFVARGHYEAISPWRELVVESLSACAGLVPLLFISFQSIPE